ncbi:hypothetical protein Avbf_07459, partial [Armadillidium vulgare]
DKPLAFYIFSNNKKRVHTLLSEASYGGSCVNDVIVHLGGMRHHLEDLALMTLCYIYQVWNRYPPYSEKKINFLSFMLKERALPSWRSVSYVFAFSLGILTYYVSQQISKVSRLLMYVLCRHIVLFYTVDSVIYFGKKYLFGLPLLSFRFNLTII